jgi:Cu/Ag efflux protein CusF
VSKTKDNEKEYMMKPRLRIFAGALTAGIFAGALALALTLIVGLAQSREAHAQAASPGDSEFIDGQVMKIDESAGKITIKHGPIKKLEMDEGMTMVFRAEDPAMLKSVKAGDKIRFVPDRVKGQFTVMKLEKAR